MKKEKENPFHGVIVMRTTADALYDADEMLRVCGTYSGVPRDVRRTCKRIAKLMCRLRRRMYARAAQLDAGRVEAELAAVLEQ